MSIFSKSLEEVTAADLEALVDQKLTEWKTVEYKQSLSVDSEAGEEEVVISGLRHSQLGPSDATRKRL